jgi:gas vesicle protein
LACNREVTFNKKFLFNNLKQIIMRITTFINGMLTGMVIGLLLAPASGYETRRRLSEKINSLKRSVNNASEVAKEEVSDELTDITDEEKTDLKENVLEIKEDIKT